MSGPDEFDDEENEETGETIDQPSEWPALRGRKYSNLNNTEKKLLVYEMDMREAGESERTARKEARAKLRRDIRFELDVREMMSGVSLAKYTLESMLYDTDNVVMYRVEKVIHNLAKAAGEDYPQPEVIVFPLQYPEVDRLHLVENELRILVDLYRMMRRDVKRETKTDKLDVEQIKGIMLRLLRMYKMTGMFELMSSRLDVVDRLEGLRKGYDIGTGGIWGRAAQKVALYRARDKRLRALYKSEPSVEELEKIRILAEKEAADIRSKLENEKREVESLALKVKKAEEIREFKARREQERKWKADEIAAELDEIRESEKLAEWTAEREMARRHKADFIDEEDDDSLLYKLAPGLPSSSSSRRKKWNRK